MSRLLVLIVVFGGCSVESPNYSPVTFRDEIEVMIAAKRYDDAVRYLKAADPIDQANHDESGYYAVAQDLIVLPGVYPGVEYDRKRDWEFPGTSDAVEHRAWQMATTEFATKYNEFRNGSLQSVKPSWNDKNTKEPEDPLHDIGAPDGRKRTVGDILIVGSDLTDKHIEEIRKLTDDFEPRDPNRYSKRQIEHTGPNRATNSWQTGHMQVYQKLVLENGLWTIDEDGGGFGQW